MVFVTSDLHFGHDRGFIYEPRGFPDIQTHDAAIISRWNSFVKPEDEVYILGDLMLNDNEHGIECLRQLNGKKYFIIGNHDTDTRLKLYEENGLINLGYANKLKYGKYTFYLSHYPTNTSNLENMAPLSQHVINLHGHTHLTSKFYQDIPYMYNVALDSHNCCPVLIETVLDDIRAKVDECLSKI